MTDAALDTSHRPNAVIRNGGPVLLRGLMLPLPPTMNSFWRTRLVKPRGGPAFASTYVSDEGKRFKEYVAELALEKGFRFHSDKRLRAEIVVCMRDRRRTDIDNRIKPALDALKDAGTFHDDEQIDELVVKRGPIIKDGRIVVTLIEITPDYDGAFKAAWR